ncbi:hypothetical protein QT971_01810 [Microcoleus sp. herbarium19]|uniref:hypothetical protein n=1 Tax=unclassified Microcoleus TaxID=2642155 RepID=UPI002FD6FFCD
MVILPFGQHQVTAHCGLADIRFFSHRADGVFVRRVLFTVIERSRKGTGFDYWLGIQDSTATLPFQRMARLEVSGIRQGNRSQINARVKQKIEQTRASDAQGLPAYIIVVEFARPELVV